MTNLRPSQLHVLVPGKHSSIGSLEEHMLASVRMRSALTARAGERLGWLVSVGERFNIHSDVLYVGKIGGHNIDFRGPAWLQCLADARTGGARIILDYTDHHCGFKSVMTNFYTNALNYTDVLITPSATMTRLIKGQWSGTIIEIPDLCEVEMQKPRNPGPGPWRALWFGSCTNVRYLIEFLSDPNNIVHLNKVNVVTDSRGFALLLQWANSCGSSVPLPRLRFFEWSLENLVDAADISDIAIIPSDPEDPRKSGVSENRLITAIQLGLIPVAAPLEAYLPFTDLFVTISTNWHLALLNRQTSSRKDRDLRQAIRENYSKQALYERWMRVLKSCSQIIRTRP